MRQWQSSDDGGGGGGDDEDDVCAGAGYNRARPAPDGKSCQEKTRAESTNLCANQTRDDTVSGLSSRRKCDVWNVNMSAAARMGSEICKGKIST